MISLLAWTLASIPYLEIDRGLYFFNKCGFCMTKIKTQMEIYLEYTIPVALPSFIRILERKTHVRINFFLIINMRLMHLFYLF